MVRSLVLLALALAAITARADAHAENDPAIRSGDAERGAAVLAPFKRQLQQALRAGLSRGPIEAIGACQLRAPEIARALSRDGVQVGRTSHRLRNPANAPRDWVRPVLRDYLEDPDGRAPRVVPISDERTGYVEPIVAQPLCLVCHGSAVAPDLAREIGERYPEDEATGFAEGDLRGVFWVELPRSGAPDASGES